MTTDNDKTAALEAKLQAAQARIARAELTNGLVLAGVNKEMLDDALVLLGSKARVAFDDSTGELTAIELDGEAYDSAADAAKAFLAPRKSFQAQEPQQQGQQPTQEQPRPEAVLASAFASPKMPRQQPKQETRIPAGKTTDELLSMGYSATDLIAAGLDESA